MAKVKRRKKKPKKKGKVKKAVQPRPRTTTRDPLVVTNAARNLYMNVETGDVTIRSNGIEKSL